MFHGSFGTPLSAVLSRALPDQRVLELLALFQDPALRGYSQGTAEALLEAELVAPVALRDAIFEACAAVGISTPAERAAIVRDTIGVARRHFADLGAVRSAATTERALANDVSRRVPTGCAAFDGGLLCGGFLRGSITEITGEAGTGKSHLALQTALHAAATQLLELRQTLQDNVASSSIPLAVIIVSENVPLQRFTELAHAACSSSGAAAAGIGADDVLNSVLVKKIAPGLQPLLDSLAAASTLSKHPRVVGNLACVVVDSIAASIATSAADAAPPPTKQRPWPTTPAAGCGGGGDARSGLSGSPAALRVAAALKRLAADLACAVVVVNQVRAAGFGKPQVAGAGTGGRLVLETPALGNGWACSVTTRLHLRMDRATDLAPAAPAARRRACLTLSSCVPPGVVAFCIRSEGICNDKDGESLSLAYSDA
jgi:RecA/RadA recombinase